MPVWLLIIVIPAAAAGIFLLLLLQLLFPMIPLPFGKKETEMPAGEDWYSGSLDGIPFLVENGLPYPGTFASTGRKTLTLNGQWEIRMDSLGLKPEEILAEDGSGIWRKETIPAVYNSAEKGNTRYEGIVWYRREFRLDEVPEPGSSVRLCFEGILLRGRVWLNGIPLGSFEGGYTSRFFSADACLSVNNTLLVMTDNRLTEDSLPMKTLYGHNPGWHPYGGIYRLVFLEVLPSHYILKSSFRWRTPDQDREAGVEIEMLSCVPDGKHDPGSPEMITAACDVGFPDGTGRSLPLEHRGKKRLSAADPGDSGITLHAWRGFLPLTTLEAWSPDAPRFYTFDISLETPESRDTVRVKSGYCRFSVENEQFLLNGSPVFLKGICKHEDHPDLGPVQTDELIRNDLDLIEELGAGYIRLSHYPHDLKFLDAAADRGFLLSEEIPLYQAGTGFAAWYQEKRKWKEFPLRLFGLRQLARTKLLDNARRQLLEMIERDRNNPAVIFWSVGNECYSLGKRSSLIFSHLRRMAKLFDPLRPVSYVELTYHVPFLDRFKQGWKEMDFLCLNSYFGWYYGTHSELPSFLEKTRKRWPGKPLILSEFGSDAAPGRRDSDGTWKAERVGAGKTYSEEYQVKTIGEYCRAAEKYPWIRGISPWVFSDFYNTWFPNNPVRNYNLKGILSRYREPKAAFHALREFYHEKNL